MKPRPSPSLRHDEPGFFIGPPRPCPVPTGDGALRLVVEGSIPVYTGSSSYILLLVAKHLVDIDEESLSAARAELGTDTIRDTVNQALARAAGHRAELVKHSLDVLGQMELDDRAQAWR